LVEAELKKLVRDHAAAHLAAFEQTLEARALDQAKAQLEVKPHVREAAIKAINSAAAKLKARKSA
jgi:hypothetical protein